MNYLWPIHLIYGVGLFTIGTVVGSFLNVCIYRIPWEKSVIWPGSHCPKCWGAIESRDNVPIVGWLLLGGACRRCRASISIRYPAIEFLVGALFLTAYLVDGVLPREFVRDDITLLAKVLYHVLLISLLVVITFIDADLTIVPASVTNLGILLGLGLGMAFPQVRPVPNDALTAGAALWEGVKGLLVGGGMIGVIRVVGGFVFRREAMGSGDIHILGMIGAFLGWQATVLAIPLAAFIGLAQALFKLTRYLVKRITGQKVVAADRELPFGPYLSLAALVLLFSWPWAWRRYFEFYFATASMLFSYMLGLEN